MQVCLYKSSSVIQVHAINGVGETTVLVPRFNNISTSLFKLQGENKGRKEGKDERRCRKKVLHIIRRTEELT